MKKKTIIVIRNCRRIKGMKSEVGGNNCQKVKLIVFRKKNYTLVDLEELMHKFGII